MFKIFIACLLAAAACAMAKPALIAAPIAYTTYSGFAPYTAAYSAPLAAATYAYPYAAGYSLYPYALIP